MKMTTYLKNSEYGASVAAFIERINSESIFGGHEEPVVTADTVKMALAELFDIWPERCRVGESVHSAGSTANLMQEALARKKRLLDS